MAIELSALQRTKCCARAASAETTTANGACGSTAADAPSPQWIPLRWPTLQSMPMFSTPLANTINIAADVAAMGEALRLLVGGKAHWYVVFFGLLSVLMQVFVPYSRYVRILKWLTLALLAYVATIFVVRIPWAEVLIRTFIPQVSWNSESVTMIVAVFGTTISPYLFFWQASQEVEEQKSDPQALPLKRAPVLYAQAVPRRIKVDTYIGMGFSNLVAFFIVLTTAATLHAHGVSDIQTSAQAASALRPLAGEFAFLLFSLGIIGTGLLAVPVLAGSAAYAMAGAFRWRNSLELNHLRGDVHQHAHEA